MPRQPNPEPRNAYGYPERSRPGYSTRLGSREQADWRDRLQRPRYALAIAIGIGLAPFLYHFGWYVGDVQLPRWITERAR